MAHGRHSPRPREPRPCVGRLCAALPQARDRRTPRSRISQRGYSVSSRAGTSARGRSHCGVRDRGNARHRSPRRRRVPRRVFRGGAATLAVRRSAGKDGGEWRRSAQAATAHGHSPSARRRERPSNSPSPGGLEESRGGGEATPFAGDTRTGAPVAARGQAAFGAG